MHTIYLVRKDDKPVYVGYTSKSVEERWNQHLKNSNKPKYPLHHAIKKHGADSFTIETLYESDDENHTLNYMEHHYIWLYRTHGTLGGYNLTIGGEGNTNGLSEKERKEREKARIKAYYEANKEKRNVCLKAYYKANKENLKARSKIHYEANKDKIKAKQKTYYEDNKENINARQKAYRVANKDKINARQKAYYEKTKICN
jgi:hypothetical protein